MILWLDAQLPPTLAIWLSATFSIKAVALRDIGLRDAEDSNIHQLAKIAGAIILSKDSDFVELVERMGAPPHLIWLRCGNLTNPALEVLLSTTLRDALDQIQAGAPIVEIV